MMSDKSKVAYESSKDILRHHGWIVLVLYWMTEVISWLSIGHWLRQIPRLASGSFGLETSPDKVKAWWQDCVFGAYLILAAISFSISWNPKAAISCLGSWLAVYVIFDSVIYHLRVLWFDDLKPGIDDSTRGVWSHRRITFLAIIGYAQSILLFSSIYRLDPSHSLQSKQDLLSRAFSTATSLSVPGTPSALDRALICLTLFYLAIVIATTASVAYKRKEFAQKISDS